MASYETNREKALRVVFAPNHIPILEDELRKAQAEIMTLRKWVRETGPRTFVGHNGTVQSVCKMSDTTFLSGSNDKTIKLWDITTGKCLKTFEGHSKYVEPRRAARRVCQVSDNHIPQLLGRQYHQVVGHHHGRVHQDLSTWSWMPAEYMPNVRHHLPQHLTDHQVVGHYHGRVPQDLRGAF